MVIKKKCWPEYFDAVASGKKKYELRLNEFEINEGDILKLEEWDPKTKNYTGRFIDTKVTYVRDFMIDNLYWSKEEIMEKGLKVISMEKINHE